MCLGSKFEVAHTLLRGLRCTEETRILLWIRAREKHNESLRDSMKEMRK